MSAAAPPWIPSAPHPDAHAMNNSQAAAYTPVYARRGFAQTFVPAQAPPVVEPPPPAQKQAKKLEWPPSVREYVQRSFASENLIAGIENAEMQIKLKEVITQAAESNTLYTIDWAKMPLPQDFIQQARMDATSHFANGSLKRKNEDVDVEMSDASDTTTPPWRKMAKPTPFEDRVSYSSKSQADKIDRRARKRHEIKAGTDSKYNSDLERRKQRFESSKSGTASPRSSLHHSYQDDDMNASSGPVIGTSQSIEKRYLRLTAPPKPETVRPLPVLEKTLEFITVKWRKEHDYLYICDQFKSLRQDLTVQHIKNQFTVRAYEYHARIALEQQDLGEFNQCQTQLRALYKENLGGNPAEFLAYRILYFLYTCNRTDMNDVLTDLTVADKKQPAVKHALQVRSTLAAGDYHKFFQLYLDTPNVGAYLMDMFVERERLAALANICKTYKPDVPIRFLSEELGFESDQQCVQFMLDHNAHGLLGEDADGIVDKLLAAKAGGLFDSQKVQAFKKVDIKGQL